MRSCDSSGQRTGRSSCSLPASSLPAPVRHPDRPVARRTVSYGRVGCDPAAPSGGERVSTGHYDTEQRPRGGRMPRRARRAQLWESALEVFVAQGYHSAAMDDIADRAGVSKPVLYQHFPGKLDLYLALLDTSCDAIVASVRAALRSTDDNKQRVTATIRAFFEYVANAQGAFRLVFESDLTNEPAVRERVDRVTHACAEACSEVIS